MTSRIAMFVMTRLTGPIVCLCLSATCITTSAAPLLELTVDGDVFVGKSVAHDQHVCWLAHQDGRVTEVSLQDVTTFRKIDDEFRGLKTIDVRNRLRREFGRQWEIVSTGHYLVCAPQGRAQIFAKQFDDIYRSFRGYFRVRGFDLPQPDFPLIAVVYPNEKAFAANCKTDGIPFIPGLRGYYHRLSNRVSVFEDDADQLAEVTRLSSEADGPATLFPSRLRDSGRLWDDVTPAARDDVWDANIQAALKNTIIHEATHQVAYNLGLHTRIGDNPKWVTEGLATMLEPEGARQNTGGKRPQTRLNQERFEWFSAFVQQKRKPRSLADFISSDRLFQTATLEAYAQAWALTFYLAETRSAQYSGYLQTISKRDPLKAYRDNERLADFQAAFGEDIDRLEVSFLRFIDDLQ